MKKYWFQPWGWIYRPVSVAGWFAVLLALIFCVQVFLAVDRHSHSVSDTLYGIFPYVVLCIMLLNWLASKTSPRRE
ncbi:hypothetical protein HYR99_14155 [Candidatus Poribacteria bacterium]|nr:hypothetical protein [Candidatus Poribacteria bacterium]